MAKITKDIREAMGAELMLYWHYIPSDGVMELRAVTGKIVARTGAYVTRKVWSTSLPELAKQMNADLHGVYRHIQKDSFEREMQRLVYWRAKAVQ